MRCARWWGLLVAGVLVCSTGAAGADEGAVDRGFGRDGALMGRDLTAPGKPVPFVAGPSVEQADGRLLVPVHRFTGLPPAPGSTAVIRFEPDGKLDRTFGGDGVVPLAFESGGEAPTELYGVTLAVSPDGRIAVAGGGRIGERTFDPAVALLEPDGTLATGFGVRAPEIPGSGLPPLDVVVDGGGRIVLTTLATSDHADLWRLLPDGTVDRSFGENGVVRTGRVHDLLPDREGLLAILDGAAGYSLVRFDDRGRPDPAFGPGGTVLLPGSERWFGRSQLVRAPDGELLLPFNAQGGGGVVRLLPDGRPDPSFDRGDGSSLPTALPMEQVWRIDVAADGSVLVAGSDGGDPIVSRLRPDGSLDRSFGCGGSASPEPPLPFVGPFGVLAQPDGGAIVVGDVLAGEGGSPFASELVLLRITGATRPASGYRLVGAAGEVNAFGAAAPCPPAVPALIRPSVAQAVAVASSPTGRGYLLAGRDGGVFTSGDATFHGSLGGVRLAAPISGMAPDPDGSGYWLVGADGGVFGFDAPFFGSMSGHPLAAPVVGIAATPSGRGYWLAAADGGVFAFGDARFAGSMADRPLSQPVVGVSASAGGGYWLAAGDGGVFGFGGAPFAGSAAGRDLRSPVVDIAADPDGTGYWLAAADGGILAFDAPHLGSVASQVRRSPVVGIATTPPHPAPTPS